MSKTTNGTGGQTTADANGNVTYTVYDDVNHAARIYPGWNSATNTTTGPTIVVRDDRAGSYTETLTISATPAVSGGLRRDSAYCWLLPPDPWHRLRQARRLPHG